MTTGLSLETWNIGCTRLIVAGSLRRTTVGLMDGEMPHKLRCQLPGVPPERNVLCGEPHVLTGQIAWSRDASPVNKLLHAGRSFHKVGACDPPGVLTPPHECLDHGDSHLLLLTWEQGRLVAQTALEG